MRIKTGLKAGEGGGGASEALTLENAPGVIRQGLADIGLVDEDGNNLVTSAVSQMSARQADFEDRIRGTRPSAEWFVDDEAFHNGVPPCVRPGIKERIGAAFQKNRSGDEVFPGQNAARAVRCTILSAVSKREGKGLKLAGVTQAVTPVQFAKAEYGESHPVTEALAGELQEHAVSSDILISDKPSRIGVTVPDAFMPGFVPFLRNRSVYLAAGPMISPMERGKLSLLIQTGGATAAYVENENSAPPRTSLSFDTRNLAAKYLKGLVVWSIHALRRSGVVTEAMIFNDMLEGGADALDDAALLSDGTGAEPLGLRYLIDLAHVGDATPLNPADTNAVWIQNVEKDFRVKLDLVVGVAKITPGRMVLFMSYREYLFLLTQRTNDGALAHPSVQTSGTFLGMPIFWSGKIATDGDPGGLGSTIIMADMTQAIMADEEGADLDVTFEASITDGTGSYKLWERDSAALKYVAVHDFSMRRKKAGAVLTDVNYGGVTRT